MTFTKAELTIIENALRFYAEEGFDGANLRAILAKLAATDDGDIERAERALAEYLGNV